MPRPLDGDIVGPTAGAPINVSVKNADFENFKAAGTLDVKLTKFELRDRESAVEYAEIEPQRRLSAHAAH